MRTPVPAALGRVFLSLPFRLSQVLRKTLLGVRPPQKVRIKREDPLLPYTTAREPLVLWDGTAALLGASGPAGVAGPAVGIFR